MSMPATFLKSSWFGEAGRIFLPIMKIDKENRMVWGIAQTEDPDHQGDLVTYEASKTAFSSWSKIGNVREMHQGIAAGSVVKVLFDDRNRRILVGVRVSKGAQDTWEKVLDGTLKGFSIGGKVLESARVWIDRLGKQVRKITNYVLDELSLVDSPANGRCMITAIQKRGNHLVANDVLDRVVGTRLTVSDVLSKRGANEMGTSTPVKKSRKKVPQLVDFFKSLQAGDEVMVIKAADIVGKSPDGKGWILKGDAPVSDKIKKEDLEDDGYADAQDDIAPEENQVDLGGHAKNLLAAHDDLHKLNGDENCLCREEPGEGEGGTGGIQAGRGSKNGKGGSKTDDATLTKVLAALDAQAKSLSGIQEKIEKGGGTIATRREDPNGGQPVEKRNDPVVLGGDPTNPGGEGTSVYKTTGGAKPDDYEKALEPLRKRRKDLIDKMNVGGLTAEEKVEAKRLNDDIRRLEIAKQPATH